MSLARGLRDRGHEIAFLVSGWNDGDFIARLHADGFPFEQIFLGRISKSLRPRPLQWSLSTLAHLPSARRQVRQHFNEYRPDAVIVNHRDWILLLDSLLRQQRVVFHVHELPEATRLTSSVYRRIDNIVSAFAAVSEHIAGRLTALGVSRDKARVVRNGIDAPREHSRAPRSNTRVPTIGIIGQIGSWKGHDDLLAALRILHLEGRSLRCAIFGSGDVEYVERLKHSAVTAGIADVLDWRGYVRDSNAIYSELDVCVVPSRFDDPFPTVALEAAFHGIPVVATTRGGLPEIVVDSETGFLVPPQNPSELADRLRWVISDATLRTRLGDRAQALAREEFTVARMVDRMESLLEAVSSEASIAAD